MTRGFRPALLILLAASAPAHRLDEYLQGTILSVEKNRIQAEITLTPGVSVFPLLAAEVDTNADGRFSSAEQQAYAGRVMRDLALAIDGRAVRPKLISVRFPALEDMQEGRGEIQLTLAAEVPAGGRKRRLTLENQHLSRISAYQVNCLVARDPAIRIGTQTRNYSQSSYRLDYEDTEAPDGLFDPGAWTTYGGVMLLALLLLVRLVVVRRQAGRRRGTLHTIESS